MNPATIKNSEIPSSLDKKQIMLAHKISEAISDEILKTAKSSEIEVKYDSGTIDIVVECGTTGRLDSLSKGRFRVFWASDGDYKIGYLPCGRPHYDGYEVSPGRWTNLSMEDVVAVYKKDIKELKQFESRFNYVK